MKIPRHPPNKTKAQNRARGQMILDEMRFLLQPDERRFATLLRAGLLEEGCNLPLCLARPAFYVEMIAALSSRLEEPTQNEFAGFLSPDPSRMDHSDFHETMRWVQRRLPDPGPLMTAAMLDALSGVKARWLIPAHSFCRSADDFNSCLRGAVNRLAAAAPRGQLSRWDFVFVRRRMRLALTASLLAFLHDPSAFHAVFGPIPRCLADMERDGEVFCRAMTLFFDQLPYAAHLASQTFWRLLQTLDTESPLHA